MQVSACKYNASKCLRNSRCIYFLLLARFRHFSFFATFLGIFEKYKSAPVQKELIEMIRSQWISYLFSIAFAMSLAHSVVPHAHPKEKVKQGKETASSHHHHGHHHSHAHSHGEKSKPALPVFAHFSNSDFIGSVKYSLQEKQQRPELTFEQALVVSVTLPLLIYQPSPVPHARDLPNKLFLSLRSLRGPPHFLS
ncbi:MAG TPA: hypothetical protein VIU12_00965 [Chryseolinea sp.]